MENENRFAPLYLGFDDGNGKDVPVLAVFKRRIDGGYILVKTISGSEALETYENLTKKEAN